MIFQRTSFITLCCIMTALIAPIQLPAQTTTINVTGTVLHNNVKPFGINLGIQDFYDSGQMLKNLVFTNPSFEGEIYQSTVRCASGTANSCTDENIYSGWPTSFWRNASYQMISGTSNGRSGSICSQTAGIYPSSGPSFTFCDSGTAPANGDYMVVKIIMPPNVGWPGGDWQTIVGNGTLGAETYDLPPGTTGKQSAILTAPTAADSIGLNSFFDSTTGKTFIQLNGSYQLTFKAKGVAGSQSLAVSLNRANAGLSYVNQTLQLTNAWAPYTINFNASENGSAIGRVELSFTTVGADTVELDDISVVQTNTDPTNTTLFRDEVVTALQGLHPGVLRLWEDQLGESLDNMLADPLGRQRSGYTPYGGFDGTDVNFQTQAVKFGLTDFLQLCQKIGADPWIVVPSTFSTGEAYNLIDYLAGPSSTPYGAKRAASGQSQPWTSVFKQIHLEFGNEAWNGGTFKGGAIEYGDSYGGRSTAIFTAIKGNASYSAPSFDLIVNGQSAAPYRNQGIQSFTLNNDSFSIAPYMMYNVTSWDTTDHLFGTTFAEAEAFVTPSATAEGVSGGYITTEQTMVGKPIVTSETNLSPSNGTMTQAALNGYTSSVGGGIAVLDNMFQELRAGVMTQNMFELPSYVSNTNQTPANSMNLWGVVLDMGVTNRKRPQYLALQLANRAIATNTATMLQTNHTGSDPTDTQYNFALNSVSLATFHFLQSFAFNSNGSSSLVVFNVNPDFAEQVNFAGPNAPTGTVVMQQLTSGNITDTNELANVVATTSTTLPNFNASATMTLPPYSMTVFTWGGTVQSGPAISNVAATNITANSAVITWTTDQTSSSQVAYGTTTSYGSQSSLNGTLVTSHSVSLSGLTAGTTYDFAAISANGTSQSTTSGNFVFTTSGSAAPQITNVTATAVTSSSAIITWTTDQASSSQVSYGTTMTYGTLSTLNSSPLTSHSVMLSGLTAGTTYDFAAISANSSSQSTTSGNFIFTTLTVAPQITNVTATSITSNSAIITWTTDQASSSQVSYGTTMSYGTLSTLNSSPLTSHSVMLSGLTAGTTYDFAAISANSSSQSTTSGNFTFTTLTVAPQITNVTATAITSNSAIITWTTDQASSSQVSYGTTMSYGTLSTLSSSPLTSHSVMLSGLTPGTTYDFAAISANSSNQSTTSGNFVFATTAAAAPQITSVTATSITATSAVITWTTDQTSSSQVSFGTTTAYGSLSTLNTALVTSHSVALSGLTAGTTYDFAVISANASNVSATSGNYVFTTTSVAPQITGPIATSITSSGATITWTTNQAATSQVLFGTTTSYGSQSTPNSALQTSHSVVLTGLAPGTTYDYAVVSANSANQSTTSGNFTFTTTSGTGTAPVITNTASWPVGDNTASILWTTDQKTTSQVNYGLTSAYGSQTPLDSTLNLYHVVPLSGLSSGTTYHFSVTSTNSLGVSSSSPDFSFTTTGTSAPPPPPVISSVTATAVSATSETITWTTDELSTSQVNFGTTPSYGSQSSPSSTLLTAHSVTLTGLTPGTIYNYDAVSANSSNASTTSGNFTFTTSTVTGAGPVLSREAAWPVGNNTATILWTTDVNSTSQVNYGATTAYGFQSPLDSTLSIYHLVQLSGLTSGTTYHYSVVSTNSSGASTTSPDFSFTTTGVAPAPGPAISAVVASGVTTNSAVITWATDQLSSTQVSYGTTTSYGSLSPLTSTLVTAHSVTLTNLSPGTTYDFAAISANASSISTTSGNFTFTTTSTTTGPMITAVAAGNITSTGATITWTTDQASSSQVNYGTTTSYGSVLSNPTAVTGHSVSLIGLTPNTTYNYAVTSTNATNNSSVSTNYTFTTAAGSTGVPPTVSYVAFWGVTGSSVIISWSTDISSSTQVAYGTTTALGQTSPLQAALTSSHGVTLTNLNPGTLYYFVAQSTDSSGDTGYSTRYSFTTLAGPPVISAVKITPSSGNSAVISWTTSSPTYSYVQYGPTTSYGRYSAQTSLTSSPQCTLPYVPSGLIHYSLVSTDGQGNQTISPDATFTEP